MTDTTTDTAHDSHASPDGAAHDAHAAPGLPTTIRDEAANTPKWVPWVGLVFLVVFVGFVVWAASAKHGDVTVTDVEISDGAAPPPPVPSGAPAPAPAAH